MTSTLHWQSKVYLALSALISPLTPWLLKIRVQKHREDPKRWPEKLGLQMATHGDTPVLWLHGVGLGELAAFRGLVRELLQLNPQIQLLITSSAKSSVHTASTFSEPQVIHQFCPLDVPQVLERFLAHWRPRALVVCDQDLWPRTLITLARAQVPAFWVNARISEHSLRARRRFPGLYRDLLEHFHAIYTTDQTMAARLKTLGAQDSQINLQPSLKRAAPPLDTETPETEPWWNRLADISYWALVSSHAADEALAYAAQKQCQTRGNPIRLVLIPRDLARLATIESHIETVGLTSMRISGWPIESTDNLVDVIIVDQYGRLGPALQFARWALIGGTQDAAIGGHNPWEAIALGCPIMAGLQTANFAEDYALLQQHQAVTTVQDPDTVFATLHRSGVDQAKRAGALRLSGSAAVEHMAQSILNAAHLGERTHVELG